MSKKLKKKSAIQHAAIVHHNFVKDVITFPAVHRVNVFAEIQ